MGIYLINSLLYYRFIISRINKCVLLYGLAVFILLCKYRFSKPGRICSGDFLSAADWHDPQMQNLYLLYQGSLLYYYAWAVWFAMFLSALIVSYIVKQMIEMFA